MLLNNCSFRPPGMMLPHFFLQIRTHKPLSPFTPFHGWMSTTGEVPNVEMLPYVFGKALKHYRNTVSTGRLLSLLWHPGFDAHHIWGSPR